MFSYNIIAVLALGSLIQAIQITSPDQTAVWESGTSGQVIEYTPVSTDQSSFAIELVNQKGFLSNSPVVLVANQSTGTAGQSNSVTVTYPSGAWPTGYGFQINFVSSSTNSDSAIYAQSNQFNITSGGSSSSSSSSTSSSSSASTSSVVAPTTISQTASSTTTVSTTSSAATSGSAAGDASGGIPNAASASASSGAAPLANPTGLVGILLGLAGLVGAFA
ncbi:hypothetical protein BCR39DRAFT_514034 [Naematelia encephala]|uniref:Yeast cell wall synthesis Kre9/Knh1-like N-terminal domain-containing protein n=1 Tax=Naematelia encephala TaxID=71784 RepID=A0A1Y2BIS6_9TREE|nr:hypothetical protein BCR39DRAFT_514034 [Naematelia encephala]